MRASSPAGRYHQWRLSGNDEAAIEAHLRDSEFGKADREFFTGLLRGVARTEVELQTALQAILDRRRSASCRRSRPVSCWPGLTS